MRITCGSLNWAARRLGTSTPAQHSTRTQNWSAPAPPRAGSGSGGAAAGTARRRPAAGARRRPTPRAPRCRLPSRHRPRSSTRVGQRRGGGPQRAAAQQTLRSAVATPFVVGRGRARAACERGGGVRCARAKISEILRLGAGRRRVETERRSACGAHHRARRRCCRATGRPSRSKAPRERGPTLERHHDRFRSATSAGSILFCFGFAQSHAETVQRAAQP